MHSSHKESGCGLDVDRSPRVNLWMRWLSIESIVETLRVAIWCAELKRTHIDRPGIPDSAAAYVCNMALSKGSGRDIPYPESVCNIDLNCRWWTNSRLTSR
jgi:hypothetical protein